jgi:predicted MFS family arabinose efflux permease
MTGAAARSLVVLSVAQFLIALDYSIIYVALPSIGADLGLQSAVTQWVISAYALFFAGFLLVGGRLTDRLGPRRLFVAAILLFGATSALGGAAQDGPVLLAARGAQGLSAALLQPAVLGLLGTTFRAGPERSRALAVWGSVGAAGLAAGVVLGGLLTTVSWRLTFLINVPLTALCALGAVLWFSRVRVAGQPPESVPVRASLLATGTVLALVGGLTLGAERGWTAPATLGAIALAVVLGLGFLRNEQVAGAVLIERSLRRTRSLRTGLGATALYMASVGSEFYLVTLLLQTAGGYSPLAAGFAFLPLAALVTVGSTAAGRAVRRWDVRVVLAAGFLLAVAGLGWLALALGGDSYAADLLPGLLLSGFGHGAIYTSMFILGTRDVPAAQQGTAGALLTTSQYVSAAVTVAVLTLVLGTAPDAMAFRLAFLLTALAAAAGAVVAATGRAVLVTAGRAEQNRECAATGDPSRAA